MGRIKVLRLLYVVILLAVVVRLFYWQILRSDDLTAMAEQQHFTTSALKAPRGQILSADGAILATNQPIFLLYANPRVLKDKEGTALKLAQTMTEVALSQLEGDTPAKIDPQEILARRDDYLSKLNKDLAWVPLEKNLSLNVKQKLEKLGVEGLGFESGSARMYPEASSAAHLLGFAGSDSLGRQTGYFGLEGFYNGELKGSGGELTEEKDARGLPILMGTFLKKEPQNGDTLVLNIDRTVQHIVEKRLKAGMEKYKAKDGSVVVMDPKTGAVVAMASYPNYDPNKFDNFPKEYFKNSVVASSYEPGSTFKVLVMAAALNENLVKPETKCDSCDGPVQISGYFIRTWDNKYYPDTTMTDVIVHSDNTGMAYVAKKLGLDKMYQYIQNFGFGALTQIDLQDESSPDIRSKNEWHEIDLATSSFGQGVAVTSLQMVRAVSAIANGGFLMEPHIVKEIRMKDKVKKIEPKVVGHPLAETTAKTVAAMMVEAVEKGEAKYLILKGYKIAGKTGTAQIPIAGHYDPNKTIASFVGFAPADDPKFVMLVKYEEPSSSIFGAETAAPTFFEITKELLMYYNISPTISN